MNKVEAITILSSALCNLSCKYCYISQDPRLKEVHRKLVERIRNEEFLSTILKSVPDPNDVKFLALWGLEPTLTLPAISSRFDYIFKTLPILKVISFSSNFQGDSKVIIDFIKQIPRDKKIELGIQFSMDGMPKIIDLMRGDGSGERIIRNVKSLILSLNEILPDMTNVRVKIQDKGTLSPKVLMMYKEDKELMFENFRFMNNFYSEISDLIKSSRILLTCAGFNQERPFNYTKEHGIAFFNMLRDLDELINKEDLKYVSLPFLSSFNRIAKYGLEFNNKQRMFTCSANSGNLCIGENDEFAFCHRDFFPENELTRKFVKEYYLIRDGQNMERRQYLTSCYMDFPKLKLEYIIVICKELARCGLIDKSYGDYNKAYVFAMNRLQEICQSTALQINASPYMYDIGSIKLFANGAEDYLLGKLVSS